MAGFVGGVGAAFIMAAIAALIVKFLLDINVIKSRDNAILYGKIVLAAIAVGIVYVSAAVFMYNTIKGQKNYFAFNEIFSFYNVDKILGIAEAPTVKDMFSSLLMPLYPILVHVFGKLVFEQYVLTAQFISFTAACASACLLYAVVKKYNGSAQNVMLLAASLPYVFMLFTPSYISLLVMFVIAAVYALSRDNNKLFIVSAILACLTCKLGFIAFLLYPVKNSLPKIVKAADIKNGIVFKVVTTVLILFNGAVIYGLIRGM